jgi:predicted lipoprotein with Yx(FWY)xxD motif
MNRKDSTRSLTYGPVIESRFRTISFAFCLALAVSIAGCAGDQPEQQEGEAPAAQTTTSGNESEDEAAMDKSAAAMARRPVGEAGLRVPAEKAQIVAGDSDFGRVLFDANGQVVYVFEMDAPDKSNCTSAQCVKAWPPVLTEEQPSAGEGVDAELLRTIRRRDGMLQVTYNGRPLYFYEHEGPKEVKCHNVNLNGGLWWVVTPSGEPFA